MLKLILKRTLQAEHEYSIFVLCSQQLMCATSDIEVNS